MELFSAVRGAAARPPRLTGVALLVALAACAEDAPPAPRGAPAAAPPAATARNAQPARDAADIRGVVTAVEDGSIRVEADPAAGSEVQAAVVTLTSETVVLQRGGALATGTDLAPGQTVSAWFTGPVAESYPVQATAETVVIEETAP